MGVVTIEAGRTPPAVLAVLTGAVRLGARRDPCRAVAAQTKRLDADIAQQGRFGRRAMHIVTDVAVAGIDMGLKNGKNIER